MAFAFGSLFAVATPPFQAPDEAWHFFRSFGVSEGHLLLGTPAGGLGLWLPASLLQSTIGSDWLMFHPERKTSVRTTWTAFAARLEPARRIRFGRVIAGYSFVNYLPQAAGIALVRLFSDSILLLFYGGRIANAAVSALLFALAVRRAAPARPLFFAISLTPMTVFLTGSLSADVATNGIAFLLIGAVLGLAAADSPGRLTRRDVVELVVLSILLGFAKPAYVLLPALILLIPAGRFGSGARQWAFGAGLVSVSVLSMFSWVALVWRVFQPDPGANAIAQTRQVLTRPLAFIAVAIRHYVGRLPALANQWAGKLGWLDTSLPLFLAVAILLTIVFVALTGTAEEFILTLGKRVVLLATLTASLLWLTLLLYLLLNRVGSSSLSGAQGRYFIPLGPLFFLALANRRWTVELGATPKGFDDRGRNVAGRGTDCSCLPLLRLRRDPTDGRSSPSPSRLHFRLRWHERGEP